MNKRSFTLVEVLVVAGIIGVVSSVAVLNFSRIRARARDQKRKADLLSVQGALEIYYANNRSYPTTAGVVDCNPTANWCGEPLGYGSKCYTDGCNPGPYIPGLAPSYIAVLPTDPTKGKPSVIGAAAGCVEGDAGYLYKSDGINYKVLAHCTVENPVAANDSLRDPNSARSSYVYAVYSSGGANF